MDERFIIKIKGPTKLGKKLGEGGEKVVFEKVDDPSRIVGVYHNDGFNEGPAIEAQRKGTFYMMNIFHIIFPKMIHSVSLVGVGDPRTNHRGYSVMNNFGEMGVDHKFLKEFLLEEKYPEGIEPYTQSEAISNKIFKNTEYKKLSKLMDEIDCRNFDGVAENWHFGPDGALRYVDTINPFFISHLRDIRYAFSPEKLKKYLVNNLEGENQKRAIAFLDRIEALYKRVRSLS